MLRAIGLSLLVLALSTTTSAQTSAALVDAEQHLRAQFVYNFANFVEWPDDAFKNSEAPLMICLFGHVHFTPYLYTYNDSLVGTRRLAVQQSNKLEQIRSGCHVLYVGEDERVRLPAFWQEIQYLYVLSIGNRDDFADKGGIINIFRTSDRMRFDVNIENALINGLFLNSDLLALARVIKRNTRPAH